MSQGLDTAASHGRFNLIEHGLEALLIGLLTFMPLAFGAVEAWSESVCVALAAGIGMCLAMLVLAGHIRLRWHWAYLPAGLLVLLAVIQIIPLPTPLVEFISPHTVQIRQKLLPTGAGGVTALSLFPHETLHALRHLVILAMCFLAVTQVIRRPSQIKRLLAAVSIVGGFLAALSLLQVASQSPRIYWLVPLGFEGVASSGSFVAHSHFGQFMNLSIGSALGLLLVKLRESFPQSPPNLPALVEQLCDRRVRIVWLLAGAVIVGAATVFLSLTRGGMIALLTAGAFTAGILAAKRGLRDLHWAAAIAMVVICLGLVLYMGFDGVYSRLGTLRRSDVGVGRWQILQNASALFWSFPLTGTGLNTHEVVYTMFDSPDARLLTAHADNEYLQLTEEMGIVGLCVLALLIGLTWRSYGRCIRRVETPIRAAAVGIGFGLLAVIIHSAMDFGQRVPAVGVLTVVLAGVLLNLDRMGSGAPEKPAHVPAWKSRLTGLAAVAVVLLVGWWAIPSAERARLAERHWAQAMLLESELSEANWRGSDAQYCELIEQAQSAAGYQSGDVRYGYWLNVYRWQSIHRQPGPTPAAMTVTTEMRLHGRRIVQELDALKPLCPTYGPLYALSGQIRLMVLDDPSGLDDIRWAYLLNPGNPSICYAAGMADSLQGRQDQALDKFRRCIRAEPAMRGQIVDLCMNVLNQPDLAAALEGQE